MFKDQRVEDYRNKGDENGSDNDTDIISGEVTPPSLNIAITCEKLTLIRTQYSSAECGRLTRRETN